MRKHLCLLCGLMLFVALPTSLFAQDKSEKGKKAVVTEQGEIKLDALHLQAIIEKPSVTLVPKRVQPDLQEVEFIHRDFDRELKLLPKDLIEKSLELKRIEKIREIDDILKRKRK